MEARGECTEDKRCEAYINKLEPAAKVLLATRGLLAKVDLSQHLPSKEGTLTWELRPPEGVIDASCTVYTDGSMVDGPTKALGRVGFGFAAYDGEGRLVAKAYGAPPGWIDSVPGAETWAAAAALKQSIPGITLWSDCLSVVNRFKAGRAAATSSKVKLARVWRTIFDLCDCYDCPERQVQIGWMPAHTSVWAVGQVKKGDGSRLSTEDRAGNAEADMLAKRGAKDHRIPKWMRDKVELAELVATRAALQLGVTTEAANNHGVLEMGKDGTARTKLHRDSEGNPKASSLRKLEKETKKGEEPAEGAAHGEKRAKAKAKESASNGAAIKVLRKLVSGRSRRTTVHGYQGKRAADRRLKQCGAEAQGMWLKKEGSLLYERSLSCKAVNPTLEWLKKQGSLLSEAANEVSPSFLRLDHTSVSLPAQVTPVEKLPSCETKIAVVSTARDRPKRARLSNCTASTSRKLLQSVQDLLAPKGASAVQ